MPLLTAERLAPNRLTYAWDILREGQAYYMEGRASLQNFDGESATCTVQDKKGQHTVTIKAIQNRLALSCTCPYATQRGVCKHIIAAALVVQGYIRSIEDRWDYRLQKALEQMPAPAKEAKPAQPYILLYGLLLESRSSVLYPYMIPASQWPNAPQEPLDPESFNRLLDTDRSWQTSLAQVTSAADPFACLNLPPEAVQTCNLMIARGNPPGYFYYYAGTTNFSEYLLILARQNVPIFRRLSSGRLQKRLHWTDRPIRVELSLIQTKEGLFLDVGGMVDEQVFSLQKNNFSIVSQRPAWGLFGDTLAPIANPEALEIVPHLSITVPPEGEATFRDRFFPLLAQRLPVRAEMAEVREITGEPVPRLYLREETGTFLATLAFSYDDYEVEANPKAPPTAVISEPGTWSVVRIHRDLAREHTFYQKLTDSQYGLKRSGYRSGPAEFQLRARVHPLDFLTKCIPLLAEAGFEIYGHEKLISARLKPGTPSLRVSISSGIDWFDIEAIVAYGDQTVSLREILKALRKGERYIKLADGTFGQVPEVWLERFKHLLGLAEETEKGMRIQEAQVAVLDPLLDAAAEVQAAREFQEKRERLRAFERIIPQPMPQGFRGELRPYQKAGVDWLHFLHDYRFGGILADDMGLGKTIQALAFLQSLKERGEADRASLLVVPKSLLVNWQREIARFTPGLRALEFMGVGRRKDPSEFEIGRAILTTYGTMLRDVEFLRTYRFHYAILDESQAIKNPLAKTARAARLLNTDHRLVMTGTPVENTTFELWSQFAFINPGLLGGLESFKSTFANPIESGRDPETAAMLRKLVYPFILRRTKAQVAPELPPRTERILFTDLEPAQRKLYKQIRDHYRAELLGLIDQGGLDNARMKILEGLLRLRQVCIHPVLVEPRYRGDSAKFELFAQTLDTLLAENHKALVYSQFVEVLKLVRKYLDERRVRYAYLDGQTRDRQGQVDLFQSDPKVPFFLLSLKAGGVGLNLTAAEYVIHLDPWWNPAVEMQAADRAHRIGQDKPVFIYKFIARETVEEKILQLQERKRELVEQLVSAEGGFFKALTREDVAVLFS